MCEALTVGERSRRVDSPFSAGAAVNAATKADAAIQGSVRIASRAERRCRMVSSLQNKPGTRCKGGWDEMRGNRSRRLPLRHRGFRVSPERLAFGQTFHKRGARASYF